ncbi:MAG TPA: aromatic acid exporter family protein [Frankiaceae bacterium]|nr:aromatic acid exporter family protein [Frankiaceae bacterium]
MVSLPRLSGRPFGRVRERLVKLVGAARDEPVRWPQVAKAALATAIAWQLAQLLPGKQPPVFAPLAAMLTIQVTAYESLRSAAQRTGGVIAGVLLAYGLSRLLGLHWWSIALVILAAMALGQALALGTTGSSQVPVSALLVLGIGAATKSYAYTRVLETLLGAAVGVAVSLVVVPPLHLRDSGRAVRRLAERQAALLREIAEDLRTGVWPSGAAGRRLASARALASDLTRAQEAVERIEDSVRLNPRARKARPAARLYRDELDALQHVQVQIRGIARTLADEAARASEIEPTADEGALTDSGPLFTASVPGSVAVAAADSAQRQQYVPGTRTPSLVPLPPELLTQLAELIESVATALIDFGSAAVDDEGRVGSPSALNTLAQHLTETRQAVRVTIRTARAADLSPATWLVVGSVLTDLRRMLGELEGSRDMPGSVPVYRPRRSPPRNPTLRRTFRPHRRDKKG